MAAKYPPISPQLFREIIRCGIENMYDKSPPPSDKKTTYMELEFQLSVRDGSLEDQKASILQSICNTRVKSAKELVTSVNTVAAEGTEYLHLHTPKEITKLANTNMPMPMQTQSESPGPNLEEILKLAATKAGAQNTPSVSELAAIFDTPVEE